MEHWNEFVSDPVGALLSFSGLTFYGGLIFGAIAVLYYANKLGVRYYHMIDAAAPGLILAYAVGRGGCQLSGDGDWGIVNTSPKPGWLSFLPDWMWSFKYPHNVINEGIPIPGCEGRFCMELPEAVFPTPFYEIIMASIIFIILWNIRKRITVPGMLFSIYLVLNGLERFLIEEIRVNRHYNVLRLSLSQAQIIALLLMICGIAGIWFFNRYKQLHIEKT
jgi:prolipoprotein diacylglyceryltransferase